MVESAGGLTPQTLISAPRHKETSGGVSLHLPNLYLYRFGKTEAVNEHAKNFFAIPKEIPQA